MSTSFKLPCDAGVIQGAETTAYCPVAVRRWVLAAAILGSSMAFIDGTAVNVALPVLQAELGATVSGLQWVVESYALLLAALMVVGGSLGDRYGRRRVFSIGTALFALASVACGLSADVTQLVIARGFQGAGGALLVPGSLALISAAYPREERGAAIGIWSAFTAVNSALGPVLGGWLVENVTWRWVFFINVPLAVIVLLIAFRRIPESASEHAGRLDWPGAMLATAGLAALVFGLIESASLGLGHPLILAAIIGGVVLMVAFVIVEQRSLAPMMPLSLFRSRTFSGANLLTLFLYGALSGSLFFLPFNLIQVQGYSATAAGAAFLPFILILSLLSRWTGGIVDRYGARLPLVVGPLICAAGYALFAVPGIGGSYWTTFFPGAVVLGLGMAIAVAPLTTVVMNSVEEDNAGIASGINNAVSRTAGLLAIAAMGIVALVVFNTDLDSHLAGLEVSESVRAALDAERVKLAGASLPTTLAETVRVPLERAIAESFVSSFRLIMLIGAGLSVAGALTAALMIAGPARKPAAQGR